MAFRHTAKHEIVGSPMMHSGFSDDDDKDEIAMKNEKLLSNVKVETLLSEIE